MRINLDALYPRSQQRLEQRNQTEFAWHCPSQKAIARRKRVYQTERALEQDYWKGTIWPSVVRIMRSGGGCYWLICWCSEIQAISLFQEGPSDSKLSRTYKRAESSIHRCASHQSNSFSLALGRAFPFLDADRRGGVDKKALLHERCMDWSLWKFLVAPKPTIR